ncbi:MAG: M81 family metallopeptidase [Sandaracinaceae bacterium]|nr:M81 family metallopeptidase [Sandaracinaceae bacterium]
MLFQKPLKRPFRIAFGRIAQETNALSPLRTEIEDFRSSHWLEGEALLRACGPLQKEVPGFLRRAELSGFVQKARAMGEVELLPTLSAWALPGGPLSRSCFEEITHLLLKHLERLQPIDGLFLSLHGAMGAEGDPDPESTLLKKVREVVGEIPIVCTIDLHANLTQARIESGAIFFAYHTNPHRDHAKRGARAASVLIRTLRREVNPQVAWRSLPMILGGSPTLDFLPPMRAIYRLCRKLEEKGVERKEVLSANLLMCHPWLNTPSIGWSTFVATNGDQGLAEKLAEELAEAAWCLRHHLPPTFPSPEEAIEQARSATWARKTGVIILVDASDVTTAGATGDSTAILSALLARGQGLRSYVAIRDPRAAHLLLHQPIGATVDIEVGGSLDPLRHSPVRIHGTICARRFDPGPRHRFHLRVIVPSRCSKKDGIVDLVITEGLLFNATPSFWKEMGLSIFNADIVVVKNFFPFIIFYAPYIRKVIYVRSQGITNPDAAFTIPFDGPIHPRDALSDWRPSDRKRRRRTE